MDFFDWFVLIVVLALALAIIQFIVRSKMKKAMEERLTLLEGFTPTQKIIGDDGNSGLAIDEEKKKVCLIKQPGYGNVILDVISYKDIFASEVFEDGNSITKSSRLSQVGGALIGGLALGGVGAIIGGLSGKKVSSGKVNRVDLRLTINNTKSPVHNVNFLNVETEKHGFVHTMVLQQARHWHGLMEVLIRRADLEDREKEGEITKEKQTAIEKKSLAEELMKLAELKVQGILSEEEFAGQKVKLLS